MIALIESGVSLREIAVFARTGAIIRARVEQAIKRAGATFRPLKDDEDVAAYAIAIGTMHRAKGLEFRAVAVMGCDASILSARFSTFGLHRRRRTETSSSNRIANSFTSPVVTCKGAACRYRNRRADITGAL